MIAFELLFMVFFTSTLSGVMGMAGGMLLMGYMTFAMAVEIAMFLHGVSQLWANGFRAFLQRGHILWSVLVPYLLASLLTALALRGLHFVPDQALIYILLGLFPFLTFVPGLGRHLSIEKKRNAFLSGMLVTAAQIAAGASGAVLDVFYLKSSLNRFEIMATKAFTQTMGHLFKLLYYLSLYDWSQGTQSLKIELIPGIMVVSMLGTYFGTRLLDKVSEERFRRYSRAIILVIGAIMFLKGTSYLS